MTINNVLQQVQTYQKSGLVYLNNIDPLINWANKDYLNFQNIPTQLGMSVGIGLAPKMTTKASLIADFQDVEQRVQQLTCASAVSSSFAFTSEQFILNQMDYMNEFGMSAVEEMGTEIAYQLGLCITSSMTYTGETALKYDVIPDNGPYRFYGDGVTPINSFGQLIAALNQFRTIGFKNRKLRCVLPITISDQIANNGLNQFATDRNNDLANSWELGKYNYCEFASSNLLPIHIGGTIAQNATSSNRVLTVVSVNNPSGAGNGITEIVATEPTSSTSLNAIVPGDLFYIKNPTTKALTWVGRKPTPLNVQFKSESYSESVAGTVTFSVKTATGIGLVSAPGKYQNMSQALVPGTEIVVIPSHQTGLIMSADPLYLAMPKMPDMRPYDTGNAVDPETNVSMRMYYGAGFGNNQLGMIYDQIYGGILTPERCLRLVFPLNQGVI